jgi:hypothetical protein
LSAIERPMVNGCRRVEYFSALIQEMDLQLEEELVLLLWRMLLETKAIRNQHKGVVTWLADDNADGGGALSSSSGGFLNRKDGMNATGAAARDTPITKWLRKRAREHTEAQVPGIAQASVSTQPREGESDAAGSTQGTPLDSSAKSPSSTSTTSDQKTQKKMYIESILLHPIKVNVTFQRLVDDPYQVLGRRNSHLHDRYLSTKTAAAAVAHGGGRSRAGSTAVGAGRSGGAPPVLAAAEPEALLALISGALSDVAGAQFRLNALMLEHALVTWPQLYKAVSQSYTQRALSQLYKIVFSAEILGNPIGLVNNLGSGVRDFFYEPAMGIVKSPQDFGEGIARGTLSLVHHTTFGAFDYLAKTSSALGAGVALLSLDASFLSERRSRLIGEEPKHVGDGMLLGALSLGDGIFNGLSGIVMQPVIGAEAEGVAGFFKGMGKGILGVAVRPTVGVFDMVSRMFVGIRNTAAMLGTDSHATHVRLPRMLVGETRTLQVYSAQLAFVQEVLFRLWGALRLRRLSAVLGYLAVATHAELLIITPNRVTCVDLRQYAKAQEETAASAAAAAGSSSSSSASASASGADSASASSAGRSTSRAELDARPELAWEIDTRGVLDVRVRGADETAATQNRNGNGTGSGIGSGSGGVYATVTVILSSERAVTADRNKVRLVTSSLEGGKCVLTIPASSPDGVSAILTSLDIAGEGEAFRQQHAIRRRKLLGLMLRPLPTREGRQQHRRVVGPLGTGATHPNLPDSGVGLVERVDVGSVAEQAGVKPGDCVVGYGGSVLDYGDYGSTLYRAVELLPAGAALELMVWRQGRWLRCALMFPE